MLNQGACPGKKRKPRRYGRPSPIHSPVCCVGLSRSSPGGSECARRLPARAPLSAAAAGSSSGRVRPALSEKSVFSSDLRERACLRSRFGVPARPSRPMRAAFGRVSPRARLLGGAQVFVLLWPTAARASSLRVRGGITRGKRRAFVTPVRWSPGVPVAGGRGGPRARPSCRGYPPFSLRVAAGCGTEGGCGGGLPGPARPTHVHRACPPRAVRSRARPRLRRSRDADMPCACRVRVLLVLCRVGSPRSSSPAGSVPTVGDYR